MARLLRLELAREARSRETATLLLLLGGLVVVVGDLAFHDLPERAEVGAGTLWLGLSFAACLAFARGPLGDRDRAALDTLLTFPASRATLYFASAAVNALLLAGLVLVLAPFHLAVAGDAWTAAPLVPVVLLGVVGLAAAGTLLAAVAAGARGRAAMFPVLLLPVVAPVLVAALHATTEVLRGGGLGDVRSEVMLLAGYDVAMLAVSALVVEHALEG